MSSLKEFQCEICGVVSQKPIHWFVIECGDQQLAILKWDLTAASRPALLRRSPRPGVYQPLVRIGVRAAESGFQGFVGRRT